ncbi:MAG: hypothetical protein HLUCCO07_15160 [Rhodobacteraceae bacterium HLUCCO07]|nr:MAG: hypothetical protein HLUCCO07_15160 [Rhodobacteraceae bacterium HLUCCO07]
MGSNKVLCFNTISEDMKKVENTNILLEELVSNAFASINNITKMLCIVFDNVIFPELDLDKKIGGNVEVDSSGRPIVKDGLLTPLPDLTVKDCLLQSGLGHLLA